MEFLSQVFSEGQIIFSETWVDDNFVLVALALFIIELVRYAFKKKLSWNMLGDSLTNFVTLFFLLVTVFFVGLAYVGAFVFAYENFSLTQLPITGWTIRLSDIGGPRLLLGAPLPSQQWVCMGYTLCSPQFAVFQHFRCVPIRAVRLVFPILLPPAVDPSWVQSVRGIDV